MNKSKKNHTQAEADEEFDEITENDETPEVEAGEEIVGEIAAEDDLKIKNLKMIFCALMPTLKTTNAAAPRKLKKIPNTPFPLLPKNF